jgi:hypothetical protein
VNT